jgi:hypothetical protein
MHSQAMEAILHLHRPCSAMVGAEARPNTLQEEQVGLVEVLAV